jgi:hypothetical protein
MVRLILMCLVGSNLACCGCGSRGRLPDDADLGLFIDVSSRCAYTERASSHDEDLYSQEMAAIEFPANWEQIVDSLLTVHGAEADFWYEIYSEISRRSRR